MAAGTDSQLSLQKSLDAVDHLRRRLMLVGYLVVAMTVGAFFWLNHIVGASADVRNSLSAAVLALTCVIAWGTFGLAIFMTRLTKRVLRAIDLALRA